MMHACPSCEVLQTLDLVGFLTLGLLGGFGHCTGMCAPFVLFAGRRFARAAGAGVAVAGAAGAGFPGPGWARPGSARAAARWQALGVQARCSAGRVATYTALGAAAGALGSAVELAGDLLGVQRAAAAAAGSVLVLTAGASLLGRAPGPAALGGRLAAGLSRLLRGRAPADPVTPALLPRLLRGRAPAGPFTLGLLLGLLPCGLIYSAVVAAAALRSPLRGGAGLALFGLGTVPALLGISLADELLVRHRRLLDRLAQGVLLAMGALLVWRALTPPPLSP